MSAVYKLATHYHLDVSLFERMVKNNLQQVTLTTQRRMRPAIASLIRNLYPTLEDHDCVKAYPNINGVCQNVFFVDHKYPEARYFFLFF